MIILNIIIDVEILGYGVGRNVKGYSFFGKVWWFFIKFLIIIFRDLKFEVFFFWNKYICMKVYM